MERGRGGGAHRRLALRLARAHRRARGVLPLRARRRAVVGFCDPHQGRHRRVFQLGRARLVVHARRRDERGDDDADHADRDLLPHLPRRVRAGVRARRADGPGAARLVLPLRPPDTQQLLPVQHLQPGVQHHRVPREPRDRVSADGRVPVARRRLRRQPGHPARRQGRRQRGHVAAGAARQRDAQPHNGGDAVRGADRPCAALRQQLDVAAPPQRQHQRHAARPQRHVAAQHGAVPLQLPQPRLVRDAVQAALQLHLRPGEAADHGAHQRRDLDGGRRRAGRPHPHLLCVLHAACKPHGAVCARAQGLLGVAEGAAAAPRRRRRRRERRP
ncbi:MAG: hypothetical protein J3K34DRAFT_421065 [Monoraphidium minutum]|nr:MAG: hypothetical protein J3K34DRAFT_421065 [Monoraphidium minutum]